MHSISDNFFYTEKLQEAANLVADSTYVIDTNASDSFRDTLVQVKNCMGRQKTDPSSMKNLVLMEQLFNILPCCFVIPILKKIFHNPPIAFTNIGILYKQKLSPGDNQMEEGFMTGSIKYRNYIQICLSIFADEAGFCTNLYQSKTDRETITGLPDVLITELQSLTTIRFTQKAGSRSLFHYPKTQQHCQNLYNHSPSQTSQPC